MGADCFRWKYSTHTSPSPAGLKDNLTALFRAPATSSRQSKFIEWRVRSYRWIAWITSSFSSWVPVHRILIPTWYKQSRSLNNGWAATHMPLPLPASNMQGYHAFKVEKFKNIRSLYITLSPREKPVCGNSGQTLSQLAWRLFLTWMLNLHCSVTVRDTTLPSIRHCAGSSSWRAERFFHQRGWINGDWWGR